jgi:hypothetical protein
MFGFKIHLMGNKVEKKAAGMDLRKIRISISPKHYFGRV